MRKILTLIIFLFFIYRAYAEEIIKKDAHAVENYLEINCKSEEKNGLVREYYKNGMVKAEIMCVGGKREEMYKSFYPNGFLDKIIIYKGDVRNGDFKKYHENGKLAHEWKFKNGEMVKNYVRQYEYYDNGNLKLEYFYDDSEGFRNEFYENGQLSSRLIIKLGMNFKVLKYNKDGRLISENFFGNQ